MKPAFDLEGMRFGLWVVLKRNPENYRRTFVRWDCKCHCGTKRTVLANSLLQGRSTGCGCARRFRLTERNFKHGESVGGKETPTYQVWKHMIQRCGNPRCKDYKYYGGRGIKVCDRWKDFSAFSADMGDRPNGLTIDRIDNDRDYEPGNCRWVSMAVQNTNKRGNFVSRRAA
jgi:hypothetical protein